MDRLWEFEMGIHVDNQLRVWMRNLAKVFAEMKCAQQKKQFRIIALRQTYYECKTETMLS